MQPKKVFPIHFSGARTTMKIVNSLAKEFAAPSEQYDLLGYRPVEDMTVPSDSLAIVGMPVYAGRIPGIGRERLLRFKGDNTPAIAVAVYGNRAYDDALAELTDLLTTNGFHVFAAAAFVAEHSIFPAVAAGRPDEADMEKIAEFAKLCLDRLSKDALGSQTVAVKGNRPYVVPKPGSGLQPTVDPKTCIRCGACEKICPTGSLLMPPEKGPVEKDSTLCIPCSACVKVCPNQTMAYRGDQYQAFSKVFGEKNAARKEPEWFLSTAD